MPGGSRVLPRPPSSLSAYTAGEMHRGGNEVSMLTRRTLLSQGLLALAATGCSRSEPGSSPPGQNRTSEAPSAARQPADSGRAPMKLTTITPIALCLAGWATARELGFFSAEGLEVEF